MNTGQMLLVIGALALLSTIAISVNSTLLDNDQVAVEAQSGIMAVSLCEGRIDSLVAVGFGSLTAGASADSIHTDFAAFACSTSVAFVQTAAPDVAVVGPTNLMRVSVTVSSDFMTGGVTLSTVVGGY